ncbi:hypothetical protein HanPSC8_Chr06g0240171 [Helianthus annuus]|nr:hypothetical protein HanPSC8_Chr06g0240171 [Helianthus annuus]
MLNIISGELQFCNDTVWSLHRSPAGPPLDGNLNISISFQSLLGVCSDIKESKLESEIEGKYSTPMVLIGIYISTASLFCILAMALDLLYGFRNRKFWFPSKYFSLNAASITVIAVTMKLPVDLTSPMPGQIDHVVKLGCLAFMCTMMSNFMPSLGSMDNKSLVANVTGLSIFVITMIANTVIQIRTHAVDPHYFVILPLFISSFKVISYISMCMLLFLLIILISSAITIPHSKKILEFKYQDARKINLNDQHPQENQNSTVEELRRLVKRYWVMAETGSPQFVVASNPLSSASGIICACSMCMYIFMVCQLVWWQYRSASSPYYNPSQYPLYGSVYSWSMFVIGITQFTGTIVGSVGPIFRCFTVLSFKSFANQNRKHFLVFKVEKHWTQKLYEWKECHVSFLSGSRRARVLLHNSKNHILRFCIGFQKVIVVSCKIIGLIPIVVIIFIIYGSYYLKSVKAKLFTPPPMASSSDQTDEDLSNYVLLLEDNVRLAEKTMKGISDSMNRLIQKAEKKQHNNLLKLLEESVAFDGVVKFDTDQIPSLLSVEQVNTWSLPIISLTCIAIVIQDIHKDRVDNLFKSVSEGLLYTHLVEESLNRESMYVNIRRESVKLWHEVEDRCKWLGTTLERSAYVGKTPAKIIKLFAHKAEGIVDEFNTSTNGEHMEEGLPPKVIVANSMYRTAQTIIHTYQSNNLEINEDELFTRLLGMIADIFSACLTNIPRVVTMRCQESAIEKREDSVLAAIDLLGRTTEIIKRLETRDLPNMDPDKMGFIDEWRLHLKQP